MNRIVKAMLVMAVLAAAFAMVNADNAQAHWGYGCGYGGYGGYVGYGGYGCCYPVNYGCYYPAYYQCNYPVYYGGYGCY